MHTRGGRAPRGTRRRTGPMSQTQGQEKTDGTFWDKMGDLFSSFGERIGGFVNRLFGGTSEQYTKKLGYVRAAKPGAVHTVLPGSLLAQVNALEETMRAKTDEELRDTTPQFRLKLANGA